MGGNAYESIPILDLNKIICLGAVVQICFVKKVFLEISQNLKENTYASLFFNEVAGLKHIDSGTGVFLYILRNVQENLFL